LVSTGEEKWNYLRKPFIIGEVADVAPAMQDWHADDLSNIPCKMVAENDVAEWYPNLLAAWNERDDSTSQHNHELWAIATDLDVIGENLGIGD
jgi:hypothetical protein